MASKRNYDSFIVGTDDFPAWFKEQTAKGKAKINRDDDDVLESITVLSATKSYIARPGDTIMSLKTGMVVLRAQEAKQYGVTKGESKETNSKAVQ